MGFGCSTAYRGRVGNKGDVAKLAQRVTALVEQGLDVAEAYATASGASTKATRDYVKALEKHRTDVRRYHERVAAARRATVVRSSVAVAAATLGVIDLASSQQAALPGPPWMWLVGGAVAAVSAVRNRYDAQHAVEPAPPQLTAAVGYHDLRRDAIGYPEAQQLAAVRRQITGMVPAVTALHPDAGRELTAADDEAAPALAAQVARLAVLDQIRRDLPGSQAAAAAGDSAQLVRARLAEGIDVYDRLLAAASTMLASPDLGRSSADVLGPASDALTAYAVGLRTAQTL